MPKVTSYENSNTLLTPNDDNQFPKRFRKNEHQESSYNNHTLGKRFHAFFVNKDSQNNNEDLKITESSRATLHLDDNQNQKHPTEKLTEMLIGNSARKKLPVIVILG